MNTIRNSFPLTQVEAALMLGETATTGIIADLAGSVSQLKGVTVERITAGWIVKSETAVRTIYTLITNDKIKRDILWHDGSADTDTYVIDVTAKTLLRMFSVIENTHK